MSRCASGDAATQLDQVYLLRRRVNRGARGRAVRLAEAAPHATLRSTLLGWLRSANAPHRVDAAFRRVEREASAACDVGSAARGLRPEVDAIEWAAVRARFLGRMR